MKTIGKRSRNPVLFWEFRNPTQDMFGEKEDVWSPYLKPNVFIRFVKNAWCIHTAECIAFQSILYYKVYYLIAYTNTNAQHVPSLSSVCAISLQQCWCIKHDCARFTVVGISKPHKHSQTWVVLVVASHLFFFDWVTTSHPVLPPRGQSNKCKKIIIIKENVQA